MSRKLYKDKEAWEEDSDYTNPIAEINALHQELEKVNGWLKNLVLECLNQLNYDAEDNKDSFYSLHKPLMKFSGLIGKIYGS